MKKIGKTFNTQNEVVSVYECPYCKERTVYPNEEHDCKALSDARTENQEDELNRDAWEDAKREEAEDMKNYTER